MIINKKKSSFKSRSSPILIFRNIEKGDEIQIELKTGMSTGQSESQKIVDKTFDEITLLASVTPLDFQRFELRYEDLFANDVFEITTSESENLIDTVAKKEALAQIANLIKSGLTSNGITINLHPGFVGEVNSASNRGVKSNTDYWFHANNPPIETEIGSMSENNASPLRFGYMRVVITHEVVINVYSYVSPVWSRLDEKIENDYRWDSVEKAQNISNLNALTAFSDPDFGQYARIPASKTGETEDIPSYNGVLSAFRCYGILESLLFNVYNEVKDSFTTAELNNIINVMDLAFEQSTISQKRRLGIGSQLSYNNDYQQLKWYPSLAVHDNYKWRP